MPPIAVRSRQLKIFFDGGCRPNPGPMEVAVVVGGRVHLDRNVGHGTGMEAEWLALLYALRLSRTLSDRDILLLGDCKAVIERANGRVSSHASKCPHLSTFRELAEAAPFPRIRYVKRSQNLAGIALARLHLR